jgi:bacillithiol biosynthesis cysteine-adding enzyme BshC
VREGFLRAPGDAPLHAKLAHPDVLVVTSGQQPALFTGPLYTVYKALSAAALAADLERAWGRPVVPVFWIAGDDHDWAEARTAHWLGSDGSVVSAALRERGVGDPMAPLARERLGPEVLAALTELEATLPASGSRDETVAWLRRHFTPEQTVAAAAGGALAELLAPHGIACFDSTARAVKEAARPLLLQALRESRELEADLTAENAALAQSQWDSGIRDAEGATLLMLDGDGGRDRLVRDGEGFITRRSRLGLSLRDVERIAAAEPERLSANVLLRPAVESALLPTVAYCGGPAELRYLRLAARVFERLGVHRTAPVPRWSGIVVDAFVDRALEKFGLPLAALADPAVDVQARAARETLPAATRHTLDALQADLVRAYGSLRRDGRAIDPTLERALEGMLRRSIELAERAEAKLVRGVRRRHDVELRQLTRARTAILPGGKPQERVVTVASVLAPHGRAVLDAVRAEAARWYAAALERPGVTA